MIPIKIIIYKEKGAWNEICQTVSCTYQITEFMENIGK